MSGARGETRGSRAGSRRTKRLGRDNGVLGDQNEQATDKQGKVGQCMNWIQGQDHPGEGRGQSERSERKKKGRPNARPGAGRREGQGTSDCWATVVPEGSEATVCPLHSAVVTLEPKRKLYPRRDQNGTGHTTVRGEGKNGGMGIRDRNRKGVKMRVVTI